MSAQTNYTVIVEQDGAGDDLILPLPAQLLDELGWHTGDTLEWTEHIDGSWSLGKKL
jgi:hypothetical protein